MPLIEMQLGRIDISDKIGELSEKYQPLNPEDLLATENIRNIISQLKKQLYSTRGANFPSIDPYKQDEIPPIDAGGTTTSVSGQVILKNLVVTGAKELNLNSHEFRLRNYRYDFNFSIPLINCEVDFQAQLLVNNLLPISLDGHLRTIMKGINLVGAGNAKKKMYKNRRIFQLTSLHWKCQVNDLRIYADYELGNSLSIMGISVKEIIKNNVATAAVGNVVLRGLNNVLRSYSAETILNSLLKS